MNIRNIIDSSKNSILNALLVLKCRADKTWQVLPKTSEKWC